MGFRPHPPPVAHSQADRCFVSYNLTHLTGPGVRSPAPASRGSKRKAVDVLGSSTSGVIKNRTKRSVVHNATSGIAPPPCAWSIEMGQCSGTRPPPGAVSPSRKRDQEAARSNNRRASPVSVPVTSKWCAQEAADQAARTGWPPGRQRGRGPS